MPKLCLIVPKMCTKEPKMCVMVPKMCIMMPNPPTNPPTKKSTLLIIGMNSLIFNRPGVAGAVL